MVVQGLVVIGDPGPPAAGEVTEVLRWCLGGATGVAHSAAWVGGIGVVVPNCAAAGWYVYRLLLGCSQKG